MLLNNPAKLRAAVPSGRRVMGLDVGTKTIGLALSDTRLVIASPLETIRRRRFADDMAAIGEGHDGVVFDLLWRGVGVRPGVGFLLRKIGRYHIVDLQRS